VSLVLILSVFRVRRVYRGLIFFSLVLILRIPAYLGIKGDQFLTDEFFSALVLRTNWCTTICITCPILRKIECIEFVCNKFELVLVQIDLIQFENSNCIRSFFTKTNTNLLHTNWIHSISRKNRTISRKIGHMIQIVIHQFVRKTSAKKILLKKIGPPLSPGTREYVESVLRRKKTIPYKPYVHGKQVESILGTRENITKKCIQFE
jgi:hypothetical protein